MKNQNDPFQRELDASLGRSFASGALDANALLAEARRRVAREHQRIEDEQRVEEGSSWYAVALLAAAASVLVFLRVGVRAPDLTERAPADPSIVRVASGAVLENAPRWSFDAPVGPLVEMAAGRPLGRVRQPDLETIYCEAMEWTASRSWNACSVNDDLSDSLRKSYGQELTLTAEGANQLQGPFSSREWPTGTILAGFPDNETAVLIAERNSTHGCCLEVGLAADSGLNVFTWPVGDIVLTEISPFSEPRLLDYIVEVGGQELR